MDGKTQQVCGKLASLISGSDALVIGAGSGLSIAAGYTYSGERFETYFSDFAEKYEFGDMYSGGFCPFEDLKEHWAYWSRYIWINRYSPIPNSVYHDLLGIAEGRDYFVLTTNVDHCFRKTGFAKERLFYTQGDYGLFQCSGPCCHETWDNRDAVHRMVLSQGYAVDETGNLIPPFEAPAMEIPEELVPKCPVCGKPMSMNLRADDTFVQDAGWDRAMARYEDFMKRHAGERTVYLEIGVGNNTPGIVKYNFWRKTCQNPQAFYVCVNPMEAYAPEEIRERSLCISEDTAEVLRETCRLLKEAQK